MITNIILIGFVPFGILLGMLMYFAESGVYKEENQEQFLLRKNKMEKSVIKSSNQIAITALTSVITAIVLHFLFIGVNPLMYF